MQFLYFTWIFFYIEYVNCQPVFRSMVKNNVLQRKITDIKSNYDYSDYYYNNYHQELKKDKEYYKKKVGGIVDINNEVNRNNIRSLRKVKITTKTISTENGVKGVSNHSKKIKTKGDKISKQKHDDKNSSYNDKDVNNFILFKPSYNKDSLKKIKQTKIEMMLGQELPLSDSHSSSILNPTYFTTTPLTTSYNNLFYNNTTKSTLHNVVQRSLKDNTLSVTHNIEDKLQNRLKKVYKNIMNKVTKKTKKKKGKFDKLPNQSKIIASSETKHLIETASPTKTTVSPKANTYSKLPNSKPSYASKKVDKNTSSPRIGTLEDDFTLLPMYEQTLSKPDNNLNILTTKNTVLTKRDAPNPKFEESDYLDNYNIDSSLSYYNDILDKNPTYEFNTKSSEINDIDFEDLSNKISYNDFVNGYKYYLKFQQELQNQNFSNLVRYQAHKHHNVDDIGKYILNKLPQISYTRSKREIIDYDTLDDQDFSTRSDDSWFKKHFFVFLDKNTRKKIHSTERVSLKSLITKNTTPTTTYVTDDMSNEAVNIHRSSNINRVKINKRSNFKTPEQLDGHKRLQDTMLEQPKNKRQVDDFKIMYVKDIVPGKNEKGFARMNLVQKTTKISRHGEKLNSKLKNLFKKFHIGKNKRINKRFAQKRIQRYNPFKDLKNIFKYYQTGSKPPPQEEHILQNVNFGQISSNNNDHSKHNKYNDHNMKINNILKQISNITKDYNIPSSYEEVNYITSDKPISRKLIENLLRNQTPKTQDFRYMEMTLKHIYETLGGTTKAQKPVNYEFNVFGQSNEISKQGSYDYKGNTNFIEKPNKALTELLNTDPPTYSQKIIPDKYLVQDDNDNMHLRNALKLNQALEDKQRVYTFNPSDVIRKLESLHNKQNNGTSTSYITYSQQNTFENHKEINGMDGMEIKNEIIQETTVTPNDLIVLKDLDSIYDNFKNNSLDNLSTNNLNLETKISNYFTRSDRTSKTYYNTKYNYSTNNKYSTVATTYWNNNSDLINYMITDNPNNAVKEEQKFHSKKMAKNKVSSNASSFKKIKTEINTPPEQYFATPIPMESQEFDKFLKNTNIDVESVTALLQNSVSELKETSNNSKNFENILNNLDYDSDKIQLNLNKQLHIDKIKSNENIKETPKLKKSFIKIKEKVKAKNNNSLEKIDTNALEKSLQKIYRQYSYDTNPQELNAELDSTKSLKIINDKMALDFTISGLEDKWLSNIDYQQQTTSKYSPQTALSNYSKVKEDFSEKKNSMLEITEHKYPLRFFNMAMGEQNEKRHTPLRNKLATRNPKRIKISRYSYNYDIIYQNQDLNLMKKIRRRQMPAIHETGNGRTIPRFYRMKFDSNANKLQIHKDKNSSDIYNLQNDKLAKTIAISSKEGDKQIIRIPFKEENLDKKREILIPYSTAKKVAALDVIVDLFQSTTTVTNNFKPSQSVLEKKDTGPQSIEVHIALPYNMDSLKREIEPVRVRKVFSAVLSNPVDLKYKVLPLGDDDLILTTTIKTTQQPDLSPGLYLLVENINDSYPRGNLLLQPVSLSMASYLIKERGANATNGKSKWTNKIKNKLFSTLTSKETIFNSSLIRLRDANLNLVKRNKTRRNCLKKFFAHERLCPCKCKVNQTMCKSCAASDKVISELTFEFENLARYMADHCTEIQTFLWMNPTDGRKLQEIVQRIHNMLNDYYKRVKGKCQGRTCQMITSTIDKRTQPKQ